MAETIFGSIEGSSRARGGGAAPAAPEKRSVMMESAQSMLTAVSAASSERAGRRGAETDHRLSARNVDRIQAFLDRPYARLGEGADAVRARLKARGVQLDLDELAGPDAARRARALAPLGRRG